jgi:DNA-binding CsgD family transcriptional regulator
MDNVSRPAVGIYDEMTLQRQMLHHNLERMPYEVLYSCSCLDEFIQNYLIHPADIILFNAKNGMEKAEEMLTLLNGNRKKPGFLFYYGTTYENELENLRKQFDIQLYFCRGRWEDIIITLDKLAPEEKKKTDSEMPMTIAPGNPFYNIASNKTCVRILELLREGKNVKQITAITSIPGATINYYLKKMRHETGCSTVVELVIDAKETGVL